jgi:hypothetical protein
VGLVEKAVEDGLGEGGVGHGAVPGVDGHLTGDEDGAALGALFDDLEEVAALLDRGGGEEEVVEDEQGDALELGEDARVAAVGVGDGEIVEQAWGAGVEGGVSLSDGGMGEGAAEVGLAAAGGAGDKQVLVVLDPSRLGEAEDDGAVESAGSAEVDVLDGGGVAEAGGLEAGLEAAAVAPVGLAVDEQAEAVLEAELEVLGVLELLAQCSAVAMAPRPTASSF